MTELPKLGLYISTKKTEGMRFVVESAYGDAPSEFYLVEVIDEASQNDSLAMGDEMEKERWESLVSEYGLQYQG